MCFSQRFTFSVRVFANNNRFSSPLLPNSGTHIMCALATGKVADSVKAMVTDNLRCNSLITLITQSGHGDWSSVSTTGVSSYGLHPVAPTAANSDCVVVRQPCFSWLVSIPTWLDRLKFWDAFVNRYFGASKELLKPMLELLTSLPSWISLPRPASRLVKVLQLTLILQNSFPAMCIYEQLEPNPTVDVLVPVGAAQVHLPQR